MSSVLRFPQLSSVVSNQSPKSTRDLRPSELRFVGAMQELGHGRFECLRILRGELVLDPWPTTIRSIKFGSTNLNLSMCAAAEFELKDQAPEFFAYVREIDVGVIRVLEVRGGLPFAMEVADHPTSQATQDDLSPIQS
jgi:hypothetical protein